MTILPTSSFQPAGLTFCGFRPLDRQGWALVLAGLQMLAEFRPEANVTGFIGYADGVLYYQSFGSQLSYSVRLNSLELASLRSDIRLARS